MSVYLTKLSNVGWTLCVEDDNIERGHVDWPIKYNDGRIAYDDPFRVSARDKDNTVLTFQAIDGEFSFVVWKWKKEGAQFGNHPAFYFVEGLWRGENESLASLLGRVKRHMRNEAYYKGYDKFVPDASLVGGYYVDPSGNCLICLPGTSMPWWVLE